MFEHDETILQAATYSSKKNDNKIINLLYKFIESSKLSIDLNNRSSYDGITILQQSIITNNINLFKKLINNDIVNINLTDYYGFSPLHFIIQIGRLNFLDEFFKLPIENINFNILNINNNLPLHLIFIYNLNIDLTIFIKNTNLNIINNDNETCFSYIIKYNLLYEYQHILINKILNINIINIDIQNEYLLNILIDSYYNQLILNKHNLKDKWENINNEKLTKIKIKNIIVSSKQSIPKIKTLEPKLDINSKINYDNCFYTGSDIDIIFGLILLYNKFKSKGLNIILEHKITGNVQLETFLNKNYNFSLLRFFTNLGILWIENKIFYSNNFDNLIYKKLKTSKYIIIQILIWSKLYNGHANIIFWDVKKKIINRFEPHGYSIPYNYNPLLLDSVLFKKMQSFDKDIIYLDPMKYLPAVGFQRIESNEPQKWDRIGDVSGYCAAWCIWWVYQKMLNLHIENLEEQLINKIKINNYINNSSFRMIIRNFSKKIIIIRDKFLKKHNMHINDYQNSNFDNTFIDKIEEFIKKNE